MSDAGSSEIAIIAALRAATLAQYGDLRRAAVLVANKLQALHKTPTDEFFATVAAVDAYSLAVDGLAKSAAREHTAAEGALLTALLDAGAPTLRMNGHALSTRQNGAIVKIPSIDAVPPKFLEARDPAPDRSAIRAYLKSNPTCNWASLEEGSISLTRKPMA